MKIKRIQLSIFFATIVIGHIAGQNLIQNFSFESSSSNHAYQTPLSEYIPPWTSSNKEVFVDYYSPIARDSLFQNETRFGNTFLAIGNFDGISLEGKNSFCHGYATSPLLTSTTKNSSYYFECKIFVSKQSTNITNGFGAFFTKGPIKFDSCKSMTIIPQIFSDEIILDTTVWQVFSSVFIADQSYKFITLGVFYPDSTYLSQEMKTSRIDKSKIYFSYQQFEANRLIIDDLKFYKLDESSMKSEWKIYFDTNEGTLDNVDMVSVDSIYNSYISGKYSRIIINGFADNIGDEKYNFQLSKDRAIVIKNYLENLGISSDNIIVNGYGSQNSNTNLNTDETRRLNRRSDIKLIKFNE